MRTIVKLNYRYARAMCAGIRAGVFAGGMIGMWIAALGGCAGLTALSLGIALAAPIIL